MHTYLIAGHSLLEQGLDSNESIMITLELDYDDGVIIDAVCTLESKKEREKIQKLMRGYCLRKGIDGLVEKIQSCFNGAVGQAIQSALLDAFSQFENVPMRRSWFYR